MKYELGEKTMTDCVTLRHKKYSHLTDDNNEYIKRKGTKMSLIKRHLKFQDQKNVWKQINLKK